MSTPNKVIPGFIELTKPSGARWLVNVDHIAALLPRSAETVWIRINGEDDRHLFTESYDIVLKLIAIAQARS